MLDYPKPSNSSGGCWSACCWSASPSWTATTWAWARCCPSSARTTSSAASSSTPSARTGTATRCGSSPAAAPSSPPGRWSMPPPSRLLLGHAGGAVGAVLPPGGLRLPQQDPQRHLAQHLGLGPVRRRRGAAADLRRGLRQPAAGRALPLRRHLVSTYTGSFWAAAQPLRAAGRRGVHGDDHLPRRDLPGAPHRGLWALPALAYAGALAAGLLAARRTLSCLRRLVLSIVGVIGTAGRGDVPVRDAVVHRAWQRSLTVWDSVSSH
jgi:hypothetical protein